MIGKIFRKIVFKEPEEKLMGKICEIYQQNIDETLPKEFEKNDDGQRMYPNKVTYSFEHWIGRCKGHLSEDMRSLILMVCEYQTDRDSKTFQSGYQDDPINLMLYEFNNWAVEFSGRAITRELLTELSARSKYLMDLFLVDESTLCESRVYKQTIKDLLKFLAKIYIYLSEDLTREVENKLNSQSSKEKIDNINSRIKTFLNTSLFLLLRFFNIEELDNTEIAESIFDKKIPIRNPHRNRQLSSSSSSSFFSSDSSQSREAFLLTIIKILRYQSNISYELKQAGMNEESISEIIDLADPQARMIQKRQAKTLKAVEDNMADRLDEFFDCYAYLSGILALTNVLELAARCARLGGDFLVYGMTKDILYFVVVDLIELLQKTHNALSLIHSHALRTRISDVIGENLNYDNVSHKKSDSQWRRNFNHVVSVYKDNTVTYRSCLEDMKSFLSEISDKSINSLREETFQAFKDFTQTFSLHSNLVRKNILLKQPAHISLDPQLFVNKNQPAIMSSDKTVGKLPLLGTTYPALNEKEMTKKASGIRCFFEAGNSSNNEEEFGVLFGILIANFEQDDFITSMQIAQNILQAEACENRNQYLACASYIYVVSCSMLGAFDEALEEINSWGDGWTPRLKKFLELENKLINILHPKGNDVGETLSLVKELTEEVEKTVIHLEVEDLAYKRITAIRSILKKVQKEYELKCDIQEKSRNSVSSLIAMRKKQNEKALKEIKGRKSPETVAFRNRLETQNIIYEESDKLIQPKESNKHHKYGMNNHENNDSSSDETSLCSGDLCRRCTIM